MVNAEKVKRKLPGILINDNTGGGDSEYQHKRGKLSELQRKHPERFQNMFSGIMRALDELDREAEQAGFLHVDFDEDGNLIRKTKKR